MLAANAGIALAWLSSIFPLELLSGTAMPFDTHASDDHILIIGGGMAGSLLALVLGRQGLAVTVIDPHRDPPAMFRNEKLGTEQIELLKGLGALACFEAACWPEGSYPGGRPSLTDCGAHHQAWLRSVRAAWPDTVSFIESTVESVATSQDRQTITTSAGETLTGRLVVLASGRMHHLHRQLGIELTTLSAQHSVCLGFSLESEHFIPSQVHDLPHGSGIGYVSIFPMPGETRVNIFSYRALSDPWTRRMAKDPLGALAEVSSEAAQALDGACVLRRCEARATDLYATHGHVQDGVVLMGDAFHAPCPASGTGMLRILHDITVLTRDHLPAWLETPGMDRDKIAAFYNDPAKRRLDARSLTSSLRGRGAAVGQGLRWDTWRLLKSVKRALAA